MKQTTTRKTGVFALPIGAKQPGRPGAGNLGHAVSTRALTLPLATPYREGTFQGTQPPSQQKDPARIHNSTKSYTITKLLNQGVFSDELTSVVSPVFFWLFDITPCSASLNFPS